MKKVASVIQTSSEIFDTPRTIEKFGELLLAAKKDGAELAVFPEAFLGGYPKGIDFGLRLGSRHPDGREMFRRYYDAALALDDEFFGTVRSLIADINLACVVGFVERRAGTLYCSAGFFDADGRLLGLHRKLQPTALERCIWGAGDGSDIPVVDLSIGRACAAICWENYMPLLRSHYYSMSPEFYCVPTVDDRDVWLPTMQTVALEGRCFVLSSCQHMLRSNVAVDGYDAIQGNEDGVTLIRGGSCILSPLGEVLAGPVFNKDAILTAELDMDDITRGKFDLDVAGHYSRPDVFVLEVDTSSKKSVLN